MNRLALALALCSCGAEIISAGGTTGPAGGTQSPTSSAGGMGGAAGGVGSGPATAGGGSGAAGGAAPTVTWYRDVLPIVQAECGSCHAPGGIAPFALTTYEEGRTHASAMAAATAARRMPPWMPAQGCQSFAEDRALSDAEIATIGAWAREGAAQGNPADAPAPRRPDVLVADQTVDPGVDYTPRPPVGRSDDYHCFVLDPHLTADQALEAYEIVPGVRHEVHHVALFDTPLATAQQSDLSEPGPGWTCFGGGGDGAAILGSWVPGSPVTRHPAGTSVRLRVGHALVMQVHYNTQNGPVVPDRTSVKLKYGSLATTREAGIAGVANTSFVIPPNAVGYPAIASGSLPAGVRIHGVQPHMHTLGKRIRMELVSGTQSTCLIDVPAWSFHWQQMYFFADPRGLAVPAGAQLRISCSWDNPSSQTVRFGEGTSDEMCGAGVYLAPPSP